jgi:diguanylate cyclase (GGDEF)-like protein
MLWSVEHLRRWFGRFAQSASVDPDERQLAGVVCGVLWLIGALTFPLFLFLPGVPHAHPVPMLALSVSGLVLGLAMVTVVDWRRHPAWLLHAFTASAFVAIMVAVAASGASQSSAWSYLFFAAAFSAYFFRRPVAIVYLVVCVLTHALVLIYDDEALHDAFIGQLVIASAGYVGLGVAIIAGRERLTTLRDRAEHLAAEQVALRRVATAVVGGCSPERIYALVAEEIAGLLGTGTAAVLRRDERGSVTVLGVWTDDPELHVKPGTVVAISPGGSVDAAIQTGRPARATLHPAGSLAGAHGYGPSLAVPVHVDGRVWGVLGVTIRDSATLAMLDESRLAAFGDLLATAILAIEDRAKLAAQASSDPLTGLANHRTLRQRLTEEVTRLGRTQGTLSVVVLDIDHFKQINDAAGHEAGDEILQLVAKCLGKVARCSDTLGRVGGDEFAWILPDATAEEALAATERARSLLAAALADQSSLVTISAGICDTRAAINPIELVELADGALYWSKAHGRNQCRIYDPAVISEMSAQDRAERLERSQALVGLRALASAIDAKDPATRAHSERVAALVSRLARQSGWPAERVRLLSEAALVHDVGKIGVPNELLRKPGPLTPAERHTVEGHAELAAQIVEGVLSPEQVEWIRTHHERPDGTGYPCGLEAHQIPDGAALLALADAWDVMTVSRPYSVPKSPDEALTECLSLVGRQFSRRAVSALMALQDKGELGPEARPAADLLAMV